MKNLTAIVAFVLVGTVCLLLGYYLGSKKPAVQPQNIRIMNYTELGPQLPETTERVEAIYPKSALADKYEGTVAVEVSIGEQGQVVTAKVDDKVRKDVADAAISAALKWKFKPITVNGKLTTARAIIPFIFKLDSTKSTR